MDYRFRHELKFLISRKEYDVTKKRFAAILKKDTHANQDNAYHIRSLYFDDLKHTDFFSKLSGLETRKKYRIRMYNHDTNFIRFEKKYKQKDVSAKSQFIITNQIAKQILHGKFEALENLNDELASEVLLYHKTNVLRPSVITDYIREAYLFSPGNVRITFDSDLRTGLLGKDFFHANSLLIPAIGRDQVILEVKYDQFLPDLIRMMLAGINGIEMSISKFALCKRFITTNDWEVQ